MTDKISKADICEDSMIGGSPCGGRREFLVKASTIAGGLALTLSGIKDVSGKSSDDTAEEVVLKLDEKSPLSKVGGSQTVETKNGKVVIARTGASSFAAVSAVCTHKGGPLGYDETSKLFVCPNHGSKFGTDGSNAGGPAKTPAKSFPTASAIVLTVAPKS